MFGFDGKNLGSIRSVLYGSR